MFKNIEFSSLFLIRGSDFISRKRILKSTSILMVIVQNNLCDLSIFIYDNFSNDFNRIDRTLWMYDEKKTLSVGKDD